MNGPSHHRTALGKPSPSKWDDAQKWLMNLSRGERNEEKKTVESHECNVFVKSSEPAVVRSVHLKDTGTEMTPIATPVSPMSSASSTPFTRLSDIKTGENVASPSVEKGETGRPGGVSGELFSVNDGEAVGEMASENKNDDDESKKNALEKRAAAWDEAERAKYMARYKREEMKIQAWENHQKRKAEMENLKAEAKAERLKSRAQDKYKKKLAATQRIAEEKRANAEAKFNEKTIKISQRADYIRRTGHFPSSFSFRLPSLCSYQATFTCTKLNCL